MYYAIFFTVIIALCFLIIRKSTFCFNPDEQDQKYVIIIGMICIIILCIIGLIFSRQLL